MKDSTDIVIHINEKMDSQNLDTYSNRVKDISGVVSVSLKNPRPHLMIVAFDPGQTKAQKVLKGVNRTGVNAQLVGWL